MCRITKLDGTGGVLPILTITLAFLVSASGAGFGSRWVLAIEPEGMPPRFITHYHGSIIGAATGVGESNSKRGFLTFSPHSKLCMRLSS